MGRKKINRFEFPSITAEYWNNSNHRNKIHKQLRKLLYEIVDFDFATIYPELNDPEVNQGDRYLILNPKNIKYGQVDVVKGVGKAWVISSNTIQEPSYYIQLEIGMFDEDELDNMKFTVKCINYLLNPSNCESIN